MTCSVDAVRPTRTTNAPSFANLSAMALPIPPAAPVNIAVFKASTYPPNPCPTPTVIPVVQRIPLSSPSLPVHYTWDDSGIPLRGYRRQWVFPHFAKRTNPLAQQSHTPEHCPAMQRLCLLLSHSVPLSLQECRPLLVPPIRHILRFVPRHERVTGSKVGMPNKQRVWSTQVVIPYRSVPKKIVSVKKVLAGIVVCDIPTPIALGIGANPLVDRPLAFQCQ